MSNHAKMISGSVIAVLLGILMALPLIYTSTVIAPETKAPNMFDVNVAYSYIKYTNSTVNDPNVTAKLQHDIKYTVGLNFTRSSEQTEICDEKTEVYLIEIYSDKGHITNILKYEGIIYNESIIGTPHGSIWDFSNPFFNSIGYSGGGGSTTMWPVGESRVTFSGGAKARAGGPSNWTDTLRYADIVYIRVSRLGWSLLTGNYTEYVVLPEPEVVTEVQLDKYKDGFLYNNLITAEELSQLDDPMHPYGNVLDSNP